MNTSKGVVMKLIISSIFSIMGAFFSMPSLAQSFESNQVSGAMPQDMSSVVYKNATAGNQLAGTVDQAPGLGDGANTSLTVRFFRANDLSMTNSRSNMISTNDRASFTMNAPTPVVNGALSFVGTVCQTPLDGSVTKWIQALSLAVTQKINAAFAYSAKINKYSSFDSAITYRLHPATDTGRSDVVASIRYGIKF
jgi:hypothetical protein